MRYLLLSLLICGCASNKVCSEYERRIEVSYSVEDQKNASKYHFIDIGKTTEKLICTKWEI